MKVKNLNNSSIKTKRLIRNTFAELIKDKQELNKVTVSELVKRADINRSTFYNHYDSIYDVAQEFEAEIIKILIENNQKLNSIEDIFKYLDNVFDYLKKNENIYKLFISSKESLMFLSKLNDDISNKIYISLKDNSKFSKDAYLEFKVIFFTDGIINQVLRYFNGTVEYSLDDINASSKKLFKIIFEE